MINKTVNNTNNVESKDCVNRDKRVNVFFPVLDLLRMPRMSRL